MKPIYFRDTDCSGQTTGNSAYSHGFSQLRLKKGGVITPQWHPHANKVVICQEGEGTITVIKSGQQEGEELNSNNPVLQVQPISKGDKICIEKGDLHYFVNSIDKDLVLRVTFENPYFDTISLGDVVKYYQEV